MVIVSLYFATLRSHALANASLSTESKMCLFCSWEGIAINGSKRPIASKTDDCVPYFSKNSSGHLTTATNENLGPVMLREATPLSPGTDIQYVLSDLGGKYLPLPLHPIQKRDEQVGGSI